MRIISSAELASTPWLRLIERRYLDLEGREKSWSYIERIGERPAVLIIARTEQSGRIVLLRQYRVPLDCFVLEFPAGLVDEGEGIEEAARRELREESGFEGRICSLSPPVCTSPGLTNERVTIVTMLVPEQASCAPAHEPSEEIEVLTPSLDELGALIEGSAREVPPLVVDSRVYSWWLAHAFRA